MSPSRGGRVGLVCWQGEVPGIKNGFNCLVGAQRGGSFQEDNLRITKLTNSGYLPLLKNAL